MENKKISISKLFRRTIMINFTAIILIIIFLAILLYHVANNDYESRQLVDKLGYERALTQTMAKNSTRIYALMEALNSNRLVEPREVVQNKVVECQRKLITDMNSYQSVFDTIKQGYIIANDKQIKFDNSIQPFTDSIRNIENIWPKFSDSVKIMIDAKELNYDVTSAAIFINENNEKLLEYSDLITQTIVDDAKSKSHRNMTILSLLVLVSFLVIAVSLLYLNKYILLPLDELYKGMSQLGLSKDFSKGSFNPTSSKIEPITSEINEMLQKFNKLISLIENINQNSSFNEILQFIYHSFSSFIPYTYIGIALITDDGKNLKASYGISGKKLPGLPENLLGIKTPIIDTSLNSVINTGKPRIINDLKAYTLNRPFRGYNQVILSAGIKASITLPLKYNNKPIGIIFFSSDQKDVYTDEHVKFLQTITNSIAIAFQKNIFIAELLYSSILALAKLAESRDEDTGDHLQRMKIYSKAITQYLYEDSKYRKQIDPEYIEDIEKFSPLHDIGKVGIRDNILLKPAKLTPEEFEEMKHHAIYGGQVLRAADENMNKNGKSVFKLGIEIAEGHHEKWNGSGYPYGKKGEEIPLSARIVAIADVFDALTSKRPYKEPFSVERAYEIIVNDSGKQFDPEIVRIFVKNKDRIVQIYNRFKYTQEQ